MATPTEGSGRVFSGPEQSMLRRLSGTRINVVHPIDSNIQAIMGPAMISRGAAEGQNPRFANSRTCWMDPNDSAVPPTEFSTLVPPLEQPGLAQASDTGLPSMNPPRGSLEPIYERGSAFLGEGLYERLPGEGPEPAPRQPPEVPPPRLPPRNRLNGPAAAERAIEQAVLRRTDATWPSHYERGAEDSLPSDQIRVNGQVYDLD